MSSPVPAARIWAATVSAFIDVIPRGMLPKDALLFWVEGFASAESNSIISSAATGVALRDFALQGVDIKN